MIRARHLTGVLLSAVLAACSSAPLHYYTLVAPADTAPVPATADAPFQFELLPVGIPAQVDQPQLVIREGAQGMAPLNGERWIAPLPDEVRSALSADLSRDLRTQDVTGLPSTGKPLVRIKLDLRRFDSVPGRYASIDAAWSLRKLHEEATLACTSHISEPVAEGYGELVQGHQRALARLAEQIAAAATAVAAGQGGRCPAG